MSETFWIVVQGAILTQIMILKTYESIKIKSYTNVAVILLFTLLVAIEFWIGNQNPVIPLPTLKPLTGICVGISAIVMSAFW